LLYLTQLHGQTKRQRENHGREQKKTKQKKKTEHMSGTTSIFKG